MSKNDKPWTFKEIFQLRLLRKNGKYIKDCARILGRSRFSIRQCLHRQNIVMQPKLTDVQKIIKRLVQQGRSDNFIALKINKSTYTVRYHRRKLKLKANEHRIKKHRLVCIGCNKLSPVHIARGTTELSRWKTQKVKGYENSNEIEAHCPDCFKKYGYGDLIESNWRNHETEYPN